MERLHPALYEFTDKETFERLYERQLGFIDKPMTAQEFFPFLAPFVAAIGCGHSRLLSADKFWEEAPASCFPLDLVFLETKAYITRLFEPNLPVPYFAREYGGGYEVLAKPVPRAELAFDGRLFTLIDGGCFSSTGHFCGLLKHHKIGMFVGTETGGTYECNDASHLVNLWNTGLKLYLARMTFTAAVQNMAKTTGITPDYPVQPQVEDVINGQDTIKDYVFTLIDKSKGEGGIR